MTLLLDGEQIHGHRMKITASLRIESDDISGQTSNTDKSHKGFKPKTLTVTMMVTFKNEDHLRALMRLAEATESGGELKTYRIVNDTASNFGVRQVQFIDGVSAREDDTLNAWQIQFTLSEKLSNPEKAENRKASGEVKQQAGTGAGVDGNAGGTGGSGNAPQELSGFETVLKRLDDYIGGSS